MCCVPGQNSAVFQYPDYVDYLTAITHFDTLILKEQPFDMPGLFYGNFDFEHELASSAYSRSKRLERLNAEMTGHLLALAEDGDRMFFSLEFPADFLNEVAKVGFPQTCTGNFSLADASRANIVPWGWSKQVGDFSTRQGCKSDTPPLDSVVRVNSRAFSFEAEQRLLSGIPGQAVVASLKSLEAVISNASVLWNCPASELSWLLKSEFSMSGRERISGRGTVLDGASVGWIARRLKSGLRLFFEPRLVPLFELSTQWCLEKPEPGETSLVEPRLLGVTHLLTDAAGQYLGSVPVDEAAISTSLDDKSGFALTRSLYDQAVADAGKVAGDVQRQGYHGPLGIDAMVYRSPDGDAVVRSIQDVNARLTMGRIALEWFRRFRESERPAWLLVPSERLRDRRTLPSPANPACRLTSPWVLAGQPVRRVGVLFSEQSDWQSLLATCLRP